MSRLIKKPISLPEGVTANNKEGSIEISGPKGTLSVNILDRVEVSEGDDGVLVTRKDESIKSSANSGTTWALIKNATVGVSEGFTKILEIEGVGYRASMEGNTLVMNLGFSHPVNFEIPEGIEINAEKNVITVSGIDKEKVGQVAAEIRSKKKPEPYKGKGIRYRGEVVRRKVGKKAAAAA